VKNTISRCVTYPEQKMTKKLISYHLSHNNYRNIELCFSSHQIDSLASTQASESQLPGSSDVNNRVVSVGSSVCDTCRKFETLTRLEKFIHKSQNEEGQDMLLKANAKIELF